MPSLIASLPSSASEDMGPMAWVRSKHAVGDIPVSASRSMLLLMLGSEGGSAAKPRCKSGFGGALTAVVRVEAPHLT